MRRLTLQRLRSHCRGFFDKVLDRLRSSSPTSLSHLRLSFLHARIVARECVLILVFPVYWHSHCALCLFCFVVKFLLAIVNLPCQCKHSLLGCASYDHAALSSSADHARAFSFLISRRHLLAVGLEPLHFNSKLSCVSWLRLTVSFSVCSYFFFLLLQPHILSCLLRPLMICSWYWRLR